MWFMNRSDDKAVSGSKCRMKVEPDTNNIADSTDVDMAESTTKSFKTGDTTSKSTSTWSYTDNDDQHSPSSISDLSVVPQLHPPTPVCCCL